MPPTHSALKTEKSATYGSHAVCLNAKNQSFFKVEFEIIEQQIVHGTHFSMDYFSPHFYPTVAPTDDLHGMYMRCDTQSQNQNLGMQVSDFSNHRRNQGVL